jgi:chromosomal replication initiation ATPase DnaA
MLRSLIPCVICSRREAAAEREPQPRVDRPYLDVGPAWPRMERLPKASMPAATIAAGIDPWNVLGAVCDAFFVSFADLLGKDRHKSIAEARQIAYWLLRKLCCFSYPQLGRFLGGRDHTTALHGVTKVERRRRLDAAYRERLDLLVSQLGGVP